MIRLRIADLPAGRQVADCGLQIDKSPAGVVLLEVVLALSLVVATVATVGAAINECTDAASRLRVRTHAADMAVTLASEVQIGLIEPVTVDATPYEDEKLADWTWAVQADPVDEVASLLAVEVTVTHTPTGVTHSVGLLLDAGVADETGPMEDMQL